MTATPDLRAFRRHYSWAISVAYLSALLAAGSGLVYVWPVFSGTAAVYGDFRPEWEFWLEPAGQTTFVALLLALSSLRSAWFCLNFRGQPGEGLDREGQGVITRSMTIAGLTIVGVMFAWMLRGIF